MHCTAFILGFRVEKIQNADLGIHGPGTKLRKSTVPPEKLLVFDVKEGWEPLCKFLNKPIPDEPFPNINDRDEIKAAMNKTLVICYTAQLLRLLAVVGGCGTLVWLVRKFI